MNTSDYTKARNEIVEKVLEISRKYEISKGETVSILIYMCHDIMHLERMDRFK